MAKAIVLGLAAAFVLVWWKPSLLMPQALVAASNPSRPSAAEVRSASSPDVTSLAAASAPDVALRGSVRAVSSYADAVARASPAVVNIYTARVITERSQPAPLEQLFGDYWPSLRRRVERSLGSGVIVDALGHIITNQHVIANADSIRVQLGDQREAQAKLIGSDPDTDLAVLQLSLGNLPVMPLGRSDALRVGDVVLAIGNPYGLSQTVTQGIVSATGRGQLGLATFENFIQTDAAINLGNSGGALVDTEGALVGINTAVLNRSSGGPEGIGFAIPVNLVRGVMEQILRKGHVVRGWLGLEPQDLTEEQAAELQLDIGPGVVVANILVHSPAFEAGVRPGDVITQLGREKIRSALQLVARISALRPGEIVEVGYRRRDLMRSARIRVLERPTQTRMSE